VNFWVSPKNHRNALLPPSFSGDASHLSTHSSPSVPLYLVKGLRVPNRLAETVRRHLQSVSSRCASGRRRVSVSVPCCVVSVLRRIAPVFALLDLLGRTASSGGKAGQVTGTLKSKAWIWSDLPGQQRSTASGICQVPAGRGYLSDSRTRHRQAERPRSRTLPAARAGEGRRLPNQSHPRTAAVELLHTSDQSRLILSVHVFLRGHLRSDCPRYRSWQYGLERTLTKKVTVA